MLIPMNIITSNFKNQKGRGAVTVRVPSLFQRPCMTQSILPLFYMYGETKNRTRFGGVMGLSYVRQ